MVQSAVLQVKNLHKEYDRERAQCFGLIRGKSGGRDSKKVAIDDTGFTIDAGEIFCLLGPNGAGKSTTLNAVIAETRPTWGQVSVSSLYCKTYFLRASNFR